MVKGTAILTIYLHRLVNVQIPENETNVNVQGSVQLENMDPDFRSVLDNPRGVASNLSLS